jgi:L-threonylcarbamoyladenylate synthase
MSNRSPICCPVDPLNPEPFAIQAAVRELIEGRLLAYPTETLYGLGADPRQPAALEHLFLAKGRSATKSVPLVAGSREQVEIFVGRLSSVGHRLADAFWPGPLTLVILAHPGLSGRLLGGRDSVAVRVPGNAVARDLAIELGHPITATSANRAGASAATTAAGAIDAFGSELAIVLDGGVTEGCTPSTIVDIQTSTPILLRAGKVSWDRVLQSLL